MLKYNIIVGGNCFFNGESVMAALVNQHLYDNLTENITLFMVLLI